MAREPVWVENVLMPALTREVTRQFKASGRDAGVVISAQQRLPYTHEIAAYVGEDGVEARRSGYVTDLLVHEALAPAPDGAPRWTPRVVIECKLGAVTTHDALTYSAKAATHKHVHPYLRYGIIVGGFASVPSRLLRHGAHFDFIVTLPNEDPTAKERAQLGKLLCDEFEASATLEELLMKPPGGRRRVSMIHRPVRFSP